MIDIRGASPAAVPQAQQHATHGQDEAQRAALIGPGSYLTLHWRVEADGRLAGRWLPGVPDTALSEAIRVA